jgi:hypothetical protein
LDPLVGREQRPDHPISGRDADVPQPVFRSVRRSSLISTSEVTPLGPVPIKGLRAPVEVFELDVPVEERPGIFSIRASGASRRLTRFKRLLLRESEVQPLVVIFEDLHWRPRHHSAS